MSELMELKAEMEEVKDRLETVEDDVKAMQEAALTKEDIREVFDAKVNADVAGAAKRIFWTFFLALFAGLGSLLANIWGGE